MPGEKITPPVFLSDLENGDIFRHLKAGAKSQRFIVYGNPKFNIRHGGATRMCREMDGTLVSKSCRLLVKKLGESKHKETIIKMFSHPKK